MADLDDRFWKNVDKKTDKDCWDWIGGRHTDRNLVKSYGRIDAYGKSLLAHRISWIIHFGTIPENKLVLHKCDNKACVNPAHLYLGTALDNARDREKRYPVPRSHNRMKGRFSKEDIEIMKSLHSDGLSHRKLADRFNCSHQYIDYLLHDKAKNFKEVLNG